MQIEHTSPQHPRTYNNNEVSALLQANLPEINQALGFFRPEILDEESIVKDLPSDTLVSLRMGAAETDESKQAVFGVAREITAESTILEKRALTLGLMRYDYETVSNILLTKLQQTEDSRAGIRYLKLLIEVENPKGRTMATRLYANSELQRGYKIYLAKKLIEEEHWDKKLGEYLKGRLGDKEKESYADEVLTAMIEKLGLNPDLTAFQILEKPDLLTSETLGERVEELKQRKEEFKSLSHIDLLTKFSKEENTAKLYYLLHGGEFKYSLINNYSFEKFKLIINKAAKFRVDEGRLNDFSKALLKGGLNEADATHVLDSLKSGSLPFLTDEEKVATFRADARLGSALEGAVSRLRDVWGSELKGLIAAEATKQAPNNVAEATALLDKQTPELEQMLGKPFARLLRLQDKHDDKSIKSVAEACRKEIIRAARQKKDRIEQQRFADLPASEIITEFVAKRLPSVATSFAFSEWKSHLSETLTDLEHARASEDAQEKSRSIELELTFLDKGRDFMRAVRFADGQQCCFNSGNYGGDTKNASTWIALLNRDPLSFIMDIKQKDSNEISGFVFGRMGTDPENGAPIVMLNGVYSKFKGDTVVDNILQLIEDNFARRIGASKMVIASKYGGTLNQSPMAYTRVKGLNLDAIRAIEFEHVYDDIGNIPNGPFEFEGYAKSLEKKR